MTQTKEGERQEPRVQYKGHGLLTSESAPTKIVYPSWSLRNPVNEYTTDQYERVNHIYIKMKCGELAGASSVGSRVSLR